MEIFIGLIIGTIASIAVGIWATKKQSTLQEETLLDVATFVTEAKEEDTLFLEKKLRDAIYDCERNILACKNNINNICKDQLDLLEEVGKKSYVEVKNKPLFFEYYNPTTLERHFYYQRDLSKTMAPDVLESTKKIIQKYNNHISLIITQQDLFEQLIISHKENMNRISGVKNQNTQIKKVSLHENKLAELEGKNKLEEQAIYNELMVNAIREELEHQEECLRQYIELNKKFETPFDQDVEKKFEQQIKIIISQLEKEAPNTPL